MVASINPLATASQAAAGQRAVKNNASAAVSPNQQIKNRAALQGRIAKRNELRLAGRSNAADQTTSCAITAAAPAKELLVKHYHEVKQVRQAGDVSTELAREIELTEKIVAQYEKWGPFEKQSVTECAKRF